MKIENRKVVVLGLGLTGLSAARWLSRNGARVTVVDTRAEPAQAAALRSALPDVRLVTGPFQAALLQEADLMVISPGVPKSDPAVAAAVQHGVELVGDIDLFAQSLPVDRKLLAVTGSNGKTTVTSLTAGLIRSAG